MIDKDGFRPNIGIILSNPQGKLLWAKRIGQDAWQFPQGGIQTHEPPKKALFRELYEEVGLKKHDVHIIGRTKGWLRYKLPEHLVRRSRPPICIGQKQIWFLLAMRSPDSAVNFNGSDKPEFDGWEWVDYWYPMSHVVDFKRNVYRRALQQLEPKLKQHLARHAQHEKAVKE